MKKEPQKYSKQVTVGTDPVTGKRIRKRVYANSEPALKQAEKELVRQYARNTSNSTITVKEYLDKWYAAYCTNLAINTQIGYHAVFNKLAPIYHKPMNKVLRTDLQMIVNAFWEHPTACKRLCGKLATVWEMAVTEGIVDRNIALRLSKPKCLPKEKRPLTAEEKEAIKRADFTEQERLLVDILYQFGLRPGEAFALAKSDVNFKEKTLTISKNLTHSHNKPIVKTTKTEKIRVLPVPDVLLRKFKQINSLYFFTNEDGTLLSKTQVLLMGRRISAKINIAMGGTDTLKVFNESLYIFRHNKATDLYYMSGNLSNKAKAAYMGHSEEMFIHTYSHLVTEQEEFELLRQVL